MTQRVEAGSTPTIQRKSRPPPTDGVPATLANREEHIMTARETVENLYSSFAAGDVPAVVGLLDDDIEWTEAAGYIYAGTYNGPDAVLDGVFARLGGEWDGYQAVPSYLVVEDDKAVAIGTYSGRYKATGKDFSARFAHSVTVRDGKITHFEQVVDSAQVNLAL